MAQLYQGLVDRPNNLSALGLLNLFRKGRTASDRLKVRSDYH
ncbi:MAG: hypothetical protein ABI180_17210 [Microcoleus sp.]